VGEKQGERISPSGVRRLRVFWFSLMQLWRIVHYTLGFAGVICATAVAAKPAFLVERDGLLDILAWISAASVGLLVLFRPHSRANAYAAAWRHLNDACNRYTHEPGFTISKLLDALRDGEKIIAASEPTA